ncbi:MAG: ATPase, T2SS/T4P/T4SS family [bacterium]
MQIEEKALLEIITREKYLSVDDLNEAIEKSKKTRSSVLSYLLQNNYLSKDLIGQAIAEYFSVPYADLNSSQPAVEDIMRIPESTARKMNVVLFSEKEKEVILATDDPANKLIVNKLALIFPGKKITLAYGLSEDIAKCFNAYRQDITLRFAAIINNKQKIAPEIVLEILRYAIDFSASDIHFEPKEDEAIIRFRIDGVLQEIGRISIQYYDNIINYLKVRAVLRIDEHRSAQDGAIRFSDDFGEIDVRISIVPVVDGEKIVLRLLSRNISMLGIDNLGLSAANHAVLENSINKPFGMIVVSGPTGSGKTTTLYALLRDINNSEINITSIEDPVEYIISGANQIQVNLETELTFAKGLRSIVRQDPDVILVGEIRDKETAEISVNAALTGHLLFSTFHANNAASTIPRLVDMGIERSLLASTLELIVSQRLLRKICEKCRYSESISAEYLKKFPAKFAGFLHGISDVYKGKGCSACNNTGYRGRIAVFEVIKMTIEMQELIIKNSTSREIWELASSQGSISMFDDAKKKAEVGITTFEEVFRVAPPQE